MAAMLRRAAHAGALPAARRRAKHSLALPRLAELRDAARLIRTTVPPTPQYAWPLLAQDAGCAEVWVKHENHTRVGAFKVRGGLVYVDWLRRAHPEVRGLVAATRGNHGQSLALAARLGGLSCTIVVPRANSAEKNAAMASLGAQLVEHGEDFQDALEHAHALARGSAALHLVPSFHPLLVAGVGTWALELLQAAPRLQRLYVPIGLGSGVCGALAAKDALGHACEVVGVVSTAAPAYALSLARGACIAHAATTRIADGMACRQPDAGALELLAARALRVVTVDDDAVEDAMRAIFRATHNVAEGAGAAGYAALKAEAASARGAAVAGFVLCGGNVDSDVFARVLASGAARRASNGLPLMGAIGKPVPCSAIHMRPTHALVLTTALVALGGRVAARTVPVGVLGTIRAPESPVIGQIPMMALLAARHFNERNGLVCPAFAALGACDVQIEAEFVDTDLYCADAIQRYAAGVANDGWRAIIGETYSSCSRDLAVLGGIFDTVQVAASSTSPSLDDTKKYPLFARTVPSDDGLMYAIGRYIVQHGWRRIAILHSDGDYGRDFASKLEGLLAAQHVQALAVPYAFGGDPASLFPALDTLASGGGGTPPRIVVALTNSVELPAIAEHASARGLLGAGRQWIFTDGSQFRDGQSMAHGEHYDGSVAIYAAGSRDNNTRWDALQAEWPTHSWADFAPRVTIPNGSIAENVEWGFDSPLGIYAAFGYDAMAALALALCETGGETTGSALFPALVRQSFDGASGTIAFDAQGTRDVSTSPFVLQNVRHDPASGTLSVTSTATFDGDVWDLDALAPFYYAGGALEPPLDGLPGADGADAGADTGSADADADGGADADDDGAGAAAPAEPAAIFDMRAMFISVVVVSTVLIGACSMLAARRAWQLARERRAAKQQREQEALEQTRREAAASARSRLIRMVMHDLRSPLLSVQSLATVLARKPEGTALRAVTSEVEALQTCAALMEHIVSDMLDFERIEAGRLTLVMAPFRPVELLKGALATLGALAEARGVHLVAELAEARALPTLVGDLRRMQQCLNNGLSNAIKFSDRGTNVWVRLTLAQRAADAADARADAGAASDAAVSTAAVSTVAASSFGASASNGGTPSTHRRSPPERSAEAAGAPGERVVLLVSVRDEGVGLSLSELSALHQNVMFTQVGRGQLQGNGGTGLGLSIVRQLLRLHDDSSLEIRSAGHGQGTEFEMSVNCTLADEDASSSRDGGSARVERTPSLASAPVDPAAPKRMGYRVLHAEDDEFVRMTLPLATFDTIGVEYEQVSDGRAAVERARVSSFHAIVLDNQMPVLGGARAARELRAQGYRGLIIGVTGDPAGCDERKEFEAAGLDDCIDKDSVGLEELNRRIIAHATRLESEAEAAAGAAAATAPKAKSGDFSGRFTPRLTEHAMSSASIKKDAEQQARAEAPSGSPRSSSTGATRRAAPWASWFGSSRARVHSSAVSAADTEHGSHSGAGAPGPPGDGQRADSAATQHSRTTPADTNV